jgi:hypothetical protein
VADRSLTHSLRTITITITITLTAWQLPTLSNNLTTNYSYIHACIHTTPPSSLRPAFARRVAGKRQVSMAQSDVANPWSGQRGLTRSSREAPGSRRLQRLQRPH